MNPPLAGRSSAILSRFPAFQRAPTPGKVLASIAADLGRDLDESERQMMGIQRSHRLGVAEEEPDVVALAALCDLQRADFFLLERLAARGYFAGQVPPPAPGAPPLTDKAREQGAYDLFLGRLKSSVRRTVAVLLEGCGTLWALLEG